jgi:hypothetical protein
VFLNTILPAVVLTSINQLANYFVGPAMFEAVVSIASTVLMTLAAIFIAYFANLPSSPAVRLACQVSKNMFFLDDKIIQIVWL